MDARKYTVREIDWMREMIRNHGFFHPKSPQDCAMVEDQLRTFMMNGTEPADMAKVYGPGFGPYAEEAA